MVLFEPRSGESWRDPWPSYAELRETDPVHDAAAELRLGDLLRQVPLTVHADRIAGTTSQHCQWLLPVSHYLESWGDARAWDGTLSPIQPLIEPLFDTRSRLEHLYGASQRLQFSETSGGGLTVTVVIPFRRDIVGMPESAAQKVVA